MSNKHGALSHIRVLDLSRVIAGPWAAQNLADMGAEVIKVERPGVGDESRTWGSAFMRDASGKKTADSAYFLSANRGKKSITLDISTPDGQEIVRQLALSCDVVVENYKVGDLARYGLSYDDLAQVNPRLVYCSITGFGQSGPYAQLPGYDLIFQAMGGLMALTGNADSEPGGGPMKVGVAVGDILAGMYASTAILGALENRNRSGLGQHIDISLLDCVVALNSYHALTYFLNGESPIRSGNDNAKVAPYGVFACKDGRLIIMAGNDAQFRSLCVMVELPALADEPRFTSLSARLANREALSLVLAEAFMGRTMQQWMDRLPDFNVPCGPIYEMPRVFEDPQVRHRKMHVETPHAAGGTAPGLASPMRFSRTPVEYLRGAPMLGEHTDEVLSSVLQLEKDAISRLRALNVT